MSVLIDTSTPWGKYWAPLPLPATKLGHYRLLSPNAGVHVSPLQLGAMSVGDQWSDIGMGSMDKEASFKLLDAYYNNAPDCCLSQDESSEQFIGEWAEQHGIRDQLFIATKYTTNFKKRDANVTQKTFYGGNSSKTMHISVEASLKKLRTTYIDLLVSGRMECHGTVIRARHYSHGRAEGMALAPWNVLAGGRLRDDAEEQRRRETGEKGRTTFNPDWERNEDEKRMSAALEKVANEVGASTITAEVPYVFPIIGGRKVEHLLSNVEALDIALTDEHIATWRVLFHLIPVSHSKIPGFSKGDGSKYTQWILGSGHFDYQPLPQPIKPKSKSAAEN
ncbi:NADP-dependent oxidoreductase domain-containing protein [Infundibulicybe gibba]|nr:NADP-dependent oxidoreductase domain-containing protein [Infundibulicybe gibba]